ncbi:MAG: hypothetical protein ABSH05_18210 [Bryobacteraceae bacterium]|jgi:hypothetical protein
MRKLLVLVLCLALDATCFAQHRGGSRGGGGFSGRGYVSGHGSGMGGYRGSGWGHYGGGWSGGYRPFYGYRSWNRFSFGLGYGYGYTPWSYWPGSYWDYYGWYGYPYDPYPYWYGYPYVYDPDPPAAGVRVIVHSRRSADPPPATEAFVGDGQWHHFGDRPAVAPGGWPRVGDPPRR